MKKLGKTAGKAAIVAALGTAGCGDDTSSGAMTGGGPPLVYPETRRGDVEETLHGVEVADPYRWLEDLDASATADWVRRQNELTFDWLAGIPEREAIRARLEARWDYARYDVPVREGQRLFYRRNDGLQDQYVLYVLDDLEGEPRVLLDPNTLSEDGTVALGPWSVSPDGRHLAYALQHAGSDWLTWRVRDVETGRDLDDEIRWSKFSDAAWSKDAAGFYYSAYDEPAEGEAYEEANHFQKLHLHRLGTPQGEDELVLEDPEHAERGFGAHVTDDGRWLVVDVWQGTARENRLWVRDLKRGGPFVKLLDQGDAAYDFVGNVDDVFYVKTDHGADRGRVVAIELDRPEPTHWREVVPASSDTLRDVSLVGERLVCSYLRDAHAYVRVLRLDGRLVRDVELPGIGSAYGFEGKAQDAETFYAFSSFTTPPQIRRYDVVTGEDELFRQSVVDVDATRFETQQVFVTSKDGTKVPMFLVYAKGIELDGARPTCLTGYGGFDVPITPSFSVTNLVWIEMGGVLAVANLRGGGEYGEAWHEAGTKERKQNVFDDFIACAEWLIANGYTSASRLAISGGSNGGLLVGACMTQRPDLFGACLPAVGVLDMLRFHRFTIGWAWTSDYGSPEDPEAFRYLEAYSPLHNLVEGTCYPATLITTGDHDDRVVPSHSFKFAAALQRAQGCANPCLIRVEVRAGHGAGKPVRKALDEAADVWAFLVRVLDMRLPAAFGS